MSKAIHFYTKAIFMMVCMLLMPSMMWAEKEAWVEYQEETKTLTFHYDDQKDYVTATAKYELPASGVDPGWPSKVVEHVVINESFAQAHPVRCRKWFNDMENITEIQGLEYLCTDSVTDMSYMFTNCASLKKLDLSTFNTENVITMVGMFNGCGKLTDLNLTTFNTAKVNDMSYMFRDCDSLTTINLSHFRTDSVTTMAEMFDGCVSLTDVNLTSFNTEKVDNMFGMFWNCRKIVTLDLHSFSTQNVANMSYMFSNCPALTQIYVTRSFVTDQVTQSVCMFWKTTNLPNYDPNSYDKTNAKIYLTYPDVVPWVEYQADTKTLTFHYDDYNIYTTATAKYDLPSGTTPRWYDYHSDIEHVVFLSGFADVRPESCSFWFYGLEKVTDILGLEYLCTDSVTDMSHMFYNCQALKALDLSTFSTANVTKMDNMFFRCQSLTSLNLGTFNTQKVTDMKRMFAFDGALAHIYVSDLFTVEQVTSSDNMFIYCNSLPNYQSSCDDKSYAKDYLTYLSPQPWVEYQEGTKTLTFHNDNTRKAATATAKYDLPESEKPAWIGKDAERVVFNETFAQVHPKSLAMWFDEMRKLTDITGLEYLSTDSATDMSNMFYYCKSLTKLDLSHFCTERVTTMAGMFMGCEQLTELNLTSFSTQQVKTMYAMFRNCMKLTTLDLTSFDTQKVTDMRFMFCNGTALTHIYASKRFVTSQVKQSLNMFTGCTLLPSFDAQYTDTTKVKVYMTFISDQTWVEYQEGTNTLTFRCDARKDLVTATGKYDLPAADEDPGWLEGDIKHVVFLSGFANARPERCHQWFYEMKDLTDIQGLEYLCTDSVNDMSEMFYGCKALTSLDLRSFNTERVTTMNSMFEECKALKKLDISSFNTQKVDDMSNMFSTCESLTELDLSHFNTENVIYMTSMLCECESLTELDLSSFNTEKVNDMYYMFGGCTNLKKLDLTTFNTKNVYDMSNMFYACSNITDVDLSSFNTENVRNLSGMFYQCDKLTEVDLTAFNTAKVTDMSYMFEMSKEGCKLENIYVSEQFVTDKVNDGVDMFKQCTTLPGFTAAQVDKGKAHYKAGGYLTLRRKMSVGDNQYNVDGYTTPTCYTDVTFTDGSEYSAPCDFTFSSDKTASYSRTTSNHWATLCLPFAFSADNSTARFYSVGSYADGNIAVSALTGEIAAGTPVLAYIADGELSVTAIGAAAVAEAKQLSELKGVFAQTEVADEEYIIANDHFWNASWLKTNNEAVKNVYVAPYRASLTLTSTEAKPNSISIDLGETDGIDSIDTTDPSAFLDGAELYDLQGRRLSAPQRGVMIVRKGGVSRKVIVK